MSGKQRHRIVVTSGMAAEMALGIAAYSYQAGIVKRKQIGKVMREGTG
jgi:hypothetical protein